MANILTHSLTYKKEDVNQYFVIPAFLGKDVQDQVTVLTGVKGTQSLHYISRPTNITKASAVGFTGQGSISLTNTDVTVAALKAEFEQNGEAFVNSWMEVALANGYNLDDVENMTPERFFIEIILPVVADTVRQDKVRQMWFAGTKVETMSGTVPASNPTGTLDTNFTPYTGWWDRILTDSVAATIPAAQRITITNTGTARVWAVTLTGITAGTITLTINGTAYSQAFDTNANTTVTNWHTTHAATIAARHNETQKLTVADNTSGRLTFTATHKGASFLAAATSAGTSGTWTVNTNTAAVAQAAMVAGTADGFMQSMIEALPNEAYEMKDKMAFYVTKSFYRNYLNELAGVVLESAWSIKTNGAKVLTYEGIPIYEHPEWDYYINLNFNNVYRHRAILTLPENLIFATDGATDDEAIDTWYDKNLEMRRYRVKYRAQTTYKHSSMIVVAY